MHNINACVTHCVTAFHDLDVSKIDFSERQHLTWEGLLFSQVSFV